MFTTNHQITATDTTDGNTKWGCNCGWVTIEYTNAPSYHTPIAERTFSHLDASDAIVTGRVWAEIADRSCEFELDIRNDVAMVTAVWMGGFRIVQIIPRTADLVDEIRMMMRWQHITRLVWADGGAPVNLDQLHAA